MARAKKGARPRKAAAGERESNTRVNMNCAGPNVPTCDKADRAHNIRDESGFLRPTRKLPRGLGEFRRYHPSYMMPLIDERRVRIHGDLYNVVSMVGQVSFETQFEETAAREKRLEEMGLLEPSESLSQNTFRARVLSREGAA